MNIKVKDKHEFIDLATYGSQARQEVHPEVYIGSEHLPPFKEGDLLDAGATYSLMQQAIRSNLNLHWFETNDEFLIHLHAGDIGENDICFIVDIAAIYKAGQAIGWLDKSQLQQVEAEYIKVKNAINDFNNSVEKDKQSLIYTYKEFQQTVQHVNNDLAALDFETEKAQLEDIENDLKDELHRIQYAVEDIDVIPTDTEPREDSEAFLRSGAVYTALQNKINDSYTEEEYEEIQRTETWENGVLYVIAEE